MFLKATRILPFTGVLFGLMFPAMVRADEPPSLPDDSVAEPEVRSNYSGLIVAADVAAGFLSIAMANGFGFETVLGLSVMPIPFALASPAIHVSHGNHERALGSLALHAVLPAASAYVGYQIDVASCGEEQFLCGAGGFVVGSLIGAAAATITDAVFLARPGDDDRSKLDRRSMTVLPTALLTPDGTFGFGLSGTL